MDRRLLVNRLIGAGVILIVAALLLWTDPAVDWRLHVLLRGDPQGFAVGAADGLAAMGGFAALGPLAMLAALLLVYRRRWGEALWLIATIAVGRLLIEGIKLLVQRPRPPAVDRLADVTSWSFPSSHSAGSVMTGLAFAILAGARGWQIGLAVFATLLVGWSRVALAVHWPSDVIAGWGMGMMWVGAALRWAPPRRTQPIP